MIVSITLKAQVINEATIRAQINAVLTTNANKAITGATHRQLQQLMVTYIKSADSTDKAGLVASIATKAPIASPTFTGTVSGVTKAMVGLSNVDNTSDVSKPISTATQTALNGKTGAVPLATYSAMIALGTPTVPTYYKIAIDENKGINNSYYLWWPDGKRVWIAATDDN